MEKTASQRFNLLAELVSQIVQLALPDRTVLLKNALLRAWSESQHPGKLRVGLVPDAAQLHLLTLHLPEIGNPGKRLRAPLNSLFGLLDGRAQHLPMIAIGGPCRDTGISLGRLQGRPAV